LIHNTYLVRISTYEILASTQYWPVEVEKGALDEFITTREELRQEDATLSDFPLIVGDDKFHGRDLAKDIILVFVTDKGEDESAIGDRLDSAIKALRRQLMKREMSEVLQHYEMIIDPSVVTRLKIALVGEGGVGKTTTLHLLMGDTPPLQYVPTIALNLETVENIRFGNYSLVLWDFAGQERFRNLWKFYFHGADVIFLVCDSSLRNVIISKDIYKLIKRDAPKVPVFALANKQDKPNAMRPEVVQKILGIPTYPMVAIDKTRRDEMLRILMTAAAQFVGVVLPDLPATELLKFTDEATADAISEPMGETVFDAPLDEEEEVEEVYVNEDGQVVSAAELGDEYEIVEEVVDEAEEEVEVAEPDLLPSLSEPDEAEEIEVIEDIVETEPEAIEPEITEIEEVEEEIDIPIVGDEDAPVEHSVDTEVVEEEALEPSEGIEVPDVSLEEKSEALETSREAVVYLESWEQSVDPSEDEETRPVSAGPETEEAEMTPSSTPLSEELDLVYTSDDDSRKIAKEIISEALDADEIISAEIDRVSTDELDVALEAFSSEETMPAKDEAPSTEEIAEEALKELDDILGSPDEPSIASTDDDDDDIEEDLDALDELFSILAADD
jgi:small GTP-binding protein